MSSYIRGIYANAACDLLESLKAKGVRAQVGYNSRKRNRTLIVRTTPGNFDQVPSEWMGFQVRVEPEQEVSR